MPRPAPGPHQHPRFLSFPPWPRGHRAGLTVPRCVPLVTSEVPTGHWDIIFRKCLVTSWKRQGRSPHFTLEGRLGVQRRGLRGPREMQRHPARALSSGSPSAASNPRSLPERPQLSPAPHRWGDRAEKGNDLPRFSRVELGEEARRGGWGHRAFISSSVRVRPGQEGWEGTEHGDRKNTWETAPRTPSHSLAQEETLPLCPVFLLLPLALSESPLNLPHSPGSGGGEHPARHGGMALAARRWGRRGGRGSAIAQQSPPRTTHH